MGSILYFIPGKGTVNQKTIDEAGLGYAFERGFEVMQGMEIPEGGKGCIFRQNPAQRDTALAEVIQGSVWNKIHDNPLDAWIGINPDYKPTPKDLEYKNIPREFHKVQLADGNQWKVPIIRYIVGEFAGGTPLCFDIDFKDGEYQAGKMEEKESELFGMACEFFADTIAAVELQHQKQQNKKDAELEVEYDSRMSTKDQCMMLESALSILYPITGAEVGALQLFNTDVVPVGCLAVIDWPSLKKKTDSK